MVDFVLGWNWEINIQISFIRIRVTEYRSLYGWKWKVKLRLVQENCLCSPFDKPLCTRLGPLDDSQRSVKSSGVKFSSCLLHLVAHDSSFMGGHTR